MPSPLSPSLTMNDGITIPQLGLGVYKVPDLEATRVVVDAIDLGYSHIDTAAFYDNEVGVGRGIRESGAPRDDLFVATKVWHDRHGFDETLASFDESLDKLGLDYDVVDLSTDADALDPVKALGYQQAPVVMVDEEHWSGFRPDLIKATARRAAA